MNAPRSALTRRRRALGFSQEELAARLHVDRSTVGRWERGESEPQPWTRTAICRALQIDIVELDRLLRSGLYDAASRHQSLYAEDDPDPDHFSAAEGNPSDSELEARLISTLTHPASLDLATVEELHQRVRSLDEQYDKTPSTSLLALAGQHLGHIGLLATRCPSGRIARALDQVETEAATLMGQLVWDASQRRANVAAHGHFDQAVTAAQRAGDAVGEGLALLRKSFVSLYGEHDPGSALILTAECDAAVSNDSDVVASLAMLHTAEAHAMLGQAKECERALSAAETLFESIGPTDPAWTLYDPSQFGRMAGSCYLFLGRMSRADTILAATAGAEGISPKSRAIVLGNLSLARIRQGSLDAAVAALHQAIDTVEATRGGGGLNIVFTAGRELRPWRQSPDVEELHDRLLGLMTV